MQDSAIALLSAPLLQQSYKHYDQQERQLHMGICKDSPVECLKLLCVQILILGWGDVSFMTMLLRELDRGPAALPRGSELTLYNSREGLLGKIRDRAKLESLSILHVQGNPLDQEELKAKVDLARYAIFSLSETPSLGYFGYVHIHRKDTQLANWLRGRTR